eukprot:4777403-Pyramimonas_sp.AAC.1
MGSNSSSTANVHLLPMCSECVKRTHSLANLPNSDSSQRRDPVAVPNVLPSPMMTTLQVARAIATFTLLALTISPQSCHLLDLVVR